jgi:ATP-dependent HslUV protease, peptidase subunit HslV
MAVVTGGDGQVTLGNTIMKADAQKIRRLLEGKVLVGFAGSAADASPCWSGSRPSSRTSRQRAAGRHRAGQGVADRPGAAAAGGHAVVADARHTLLVSGTGDVIQPTDGILGIGSGGNYALAAARALLKHTDLSAARSCASRWRSPPDRHLHQPNMTGGGAAVRDLTPRQIVAELDRTSSASTTPSGPWRSPSATAGGGSSFPTRCGRRSRPRTSS